MFSEEDFSKAYYEFCPDPEYEYIDKNQMPKFLRKLAGIWNKKTLDVSGSSELDCHLVHNTRYESAIEIFQKWTLLKRAA